ncbi:FAD-binding domain-containing protein 17 [Elsinoe australis]|uniref:FAD-binding domain-containing protein 17 n=1 Tax=Elsinoe australis TaxID=40998 RepID=A0A4U7B5A7_9PEZI|nr:FAD-binding domain-containing protein 17 [Elsinoe australis]
MDEVVVIGAGPVGLFTALLIAKQGIKVTVYEKDAGLSPLPRALAYFPPVLEEFEKAGILNEVKEAGHPNGTGVDWRNADQQILAGLSPPPGVIGAIQLGQPEVAAIIRRHLEATGCGKIIFNHSFTRAEETGGILTVTLKNGQEEVERRCRFLVGADGGQSSVRRFLGLKLDGTTWDEQVIAVNMKYDLDKYGWKSANFVVDPEYWAVVAKYQRGNYWRVATSSTKPGHGQEISDELLIEKVKETCRRVLPGNTDEIEFLQVSPYSIHQRCVDRFRVGSIMLAGDAAHINNPTGGLGLTSGFLDAAHLGQAISKIMVHNADEESTLNDYADCRRDKFVNITNPTSIANLHRLQSTEPVHEEERRNFFRRLNDSEDMEFKKQLGTSEFRLSSTSQQQY